MEKLNSRLKNHFQVRNPLLDVATLWGGGWTPGSCPFDKGWRAKQIAGTTNVLVGRRGVEGCFSASMLSNGSLSVAIYLDPPEVVARQLKEGGVDARYIKIPFAAGWGLAAKRDLEREIRDLAQYPPKHKLEFLTGRGETKTVVVTENSGYWMVPDNFGFFGNLALEEVALLLQGEVIEPDGRCIRLI